MRAERCALPPLGLDPTKYNHMQVGDLHFLYFRGPGLTELFEHLVEQVCSSSYT